MTEGQRPSIPEVDVIGAEVKQPLSEHIASGEVPPEFNRLWMRVGLRAGQEGLPDEGKQKVESLLQSDEPTDKATLASLAELLAREGKAEEVISEVTEMAELLGDDFAPYAVAAIRSQIKMDSSKTLTEIVELSGERKTNDEGKLPILNALDRELKPYELERLSDDEKFVYFALRHMSSLPEKKRSQFLYSLVEKTGQYNGLLMTFVHDFDTFSAMSIPGEIISGADPQTVRQLLGRILNAMKGS